jgi:predicted Zn-dependent protease
LGLLFYRGRKPERALEFLQESAVKGPADPRPYEWMAHIAREQGDTQAAHQYAAAATRRKSPSRPA